MDAIGYILYRKIKIKARFSTGFSLPVETEKWMGSLLEKPSYEGNRPQKRGLWPLSADFIF